MSFQLLRFHARALLVLGLTVGLPACLDTQFTPIPGAFDDVALDVPHDTHDGKSDAHDAVEPPDTLPDTLDTADAPDVPDVADVPDVLPDVAPDVPHDVADGGDAAGELASDVPVVGLALGASCTTAAQCESATCIADSANHSVCSQSCTGDCPAGFRCTLAGFGDAKAYCLPLPFGLCTHCADDTDCPGGACFFGGTGKPKICELDCSGKAGAGTTCPTGFNCASKVKGSGAYCEPLLGACDCGDTLVGQQWPCEVSGPAGGCIGVQVCQASGWSACTAQLPSVEICDGLDNDCNGKIDENFAKLDQPCGSGVCAGGAWTCSVDQKSMVCSTDKFADSSDACFNGIDDNCNGQTDENCFCDTASTQTCAEQKKPQYNDIDGDGVPDANDCAPWDSSKHALFGLTPAAYEPCCKQAKPIENKSETEPVSAATADCDKNCDKLVQGCFKTDLDQDGSPAPGDCNDSDATIHPGAPDKCADGIDQNCDGTDAVCDKSIDADGDGYNALPDDGQDCDDTAPKVHPGATELCNGYDDNCDGFVDEGNPGGGAACGESKGVCKLGTNVCSHLGLVEEIVCVGGISGTTEICNGKDDDCNGLTDDGTNLCPTGKACINGTCAVP